MIDNGGKEKACIKVSLKFGSWVAGRVTRPLGKWEVWWNFTDTSSFNPHNPREINAMTSVLSFPYSRPYSLCLSHTAVSQTCQACPHFRAFALGHSSPDTCTATPSPAPHLCSNVTTSMRPTEDCNPHLSQLPSRIPNVPYPAFSLFSSFYCTHYLLTYDLIFLFTMSTV